MEYFRIERRRIEFYMYSSLAKIRSHRKHNREWKCDNTKGLIPAHILKVSVSHLTPELRMYLV